MRRSVGLASVLLAATTTSALARPPAGGEFDASTTPQEKPELTSEPRAAGAPAQGEDLGHPIVIHGLPFEDEHSTCGFRDDCTPSCTFLTGAPDVVYAFTPASDLCVDADLCGSGYDTALLVYEGGPERPAGCNDDFCGNASRLAGLHLTGGHTYFIVVDGWSTGCGDYVLHVGECPPPCPVPEPAGALPEGEPLCSDGYYDFYNMGCNDYPYTFTDIPCDETGIDVRGTYGTWIYGPEEFRDTDWYQIVLPQPTRIDYRVTGGAPTQIAILDGRRGCGDYDVACESVLGGACEPLACQVVVPAGTYWLFVAPRDFIGVACGTPYALHVSGQPDLTIGVEPSTWGGVKGRYR